jgi:polyisoprenoid-binding protein YceI
MTNYPAMLAAVAALFAGACPAAETTAKPATPAAATATGSAARFSQLPGTGSLTFSFMQAGAENRGSFGQFATEFTYDPKHPATGSLKVTVQAGSLDTQDKDRNDLLAGADLFDVPKYPTAQYTASSFVKRADGKLEAVGKLTLRGVTKDLRVPLNLRVAGNGYELSGEVTIKRLDFGVGQGEWQSTEWVGNEVKLQYKVPLVRSN